MARITVEPTLDAMLAFEHVSLDMPKAKRRVGGGRRHRLRRLAGETSRVRERIIDDLDLSIAPGDSVAVVQRGKQGGEEFLRLAAGTLIPDAGRVRRRSLVVPLLDESRVLDRSATVRHNIYLVGVTLGMTPDQITDELEWIADFAGVRRLDAYLRDAPRMIRQRVVWTVAMATRASAFAIEQAVTVGKGELERSCWTLLEQMRADGVTFLVLADDEAAVQRLCDRAIVLDGGRIAAQTDVADALSMVRNRGPRAE